jgi:hypothetical protein
VWRRERWRVRRACAAFARWTFSAASSLGRSRVAAVRSSSAFERSSSISGGVLGSAILHRRVAVVVSWSESAEEMMSMFERKNCVSAARMSRSEGGIWPVSWAVTRSMGECRSWGKVGDREGRVVSVRMRTWKV